MDESLKIKNVQKRLKEITGDFVHGDNPPNFSINEDNIGEFFEEIDKIFLEEFGKELLE